MAKLPAIQFYPGDWRKDVGVQSLSFHDRGVWFEILMLMHESEQRGVLILNSKAMGDDALSRVLGLDKQILTTTITELITSGVASREPKTGALMCRRMVRDEKLRQTRTEAGKKGGNPVLLNQKSTTGDNQNSTPSSSSSSSSSKPTDSPAPLTPEMVARRVQNQAAIFGEKQLRCLTDVAKRELGNGIPADVIASTMTEAWQDFTKNAPNLQYSWGAEKFFGEGYWKNRPGWPWKEGRAPAKPQSTMRDPLAEIRAQEEAARAAL